MNSTTELRTFFGTENNNSARPGRGPQILRLSVMLALTVATVASAQTYKVLKSFSGSDGFPIAGLVLSGSTLYGTTTSGGSFNRGVAFKMNTDGSGYAVLCNFSGGGGQVGLVLADSTLYGTEGNGGSSGYGSVFKVNTDGSGYTVLKNFTGSDGIIPIGGLVLAGSTLYGMTEWGGGYYYRCGVVFKVNTDGSGYAVLKPFTGSDGEHPVAGLVLEGSTLYGTTPNGGSSYNATNEGYGVVFKVNTDGSGYGVLKSFGGSDGAQPFGGLVLSGSTLYGTTVYGGSSYNPPNNYGYGVVFKVNTDGTGYTVLKSFSDSHGVNPGTSGLTLSGTTLYGTMARGGSSLNATNSGYGVVFKVNTDGSGYAVLKNFTGSDGANPYAGLVLAGSALYGTTCYGGSSGAGVIFSLAIAPPSITTQPLTQTAEAGTTPWFWVEVTNTPPEATYYQWYFTGTNALSGTTNAFLELPNVQPAQAGAYTVVVTNLVEAVTSAPALLSVIPPVARTVVAAVSLTGGPGSFLHLEYADSLVASAPQWLSLSNVTLSSGPQLCFDLCQPLPTQRFYRAWQTNGPQPALDMSQATEIPLVGPIGSSVRIDYINQFGPTDAWVTLDTVTLTNTPQLYFDLGMFRQPVRLYRLVPVP
jgi:uncharacterized repeat protein (TIGR03803 family)